MNWKKFARQLMSNSKETPVPTGDQNSKELFKTLNDPEISVSDHEKDLAWRNVLSATRPATNRSKVFGIIWKAAACIVVLIAMTYLLLPRKSTISTDASQTSKVSLEDGSRVFINQSSSLSFNDDFNDRIRNISLKGEAFFQVAEDELKPFVIDLGDARVTVLGTSFNVFSRPGYPEVEVIVETGKVALRAGNKSIVLQPNESGLYDKNARTLKKAKANRNHLAWRTGHFEFRSVALSEISETIERVFAVDIILENMAAGDCKVTSSFEFESLSEVLEILQLTVGFEYIRSGNTITILGDGC